MGGEELVLRDSYSRLGSIMGRLGSIQLQVGTLDANIRGTISNINRGGSARAHQVGTWAITGRGGSFRAHQVGTWAFAGRGGSVRVTPTSVLPGTQAVAARGGSARVTGTALTRRDLGSTVHFDGSARIGTSFLRIQPAGLRQPRTVLIEHLDAAGSLRVSFDGGNRFKSVAVGKALTWDAVVPGSLGVRASRGTIRFDGLAVRL